MGLCGGGDLIAKVFQMQVGVTRAPQATVAPHAKPQVEPLQSQAAGRGNRCSVRASPVALPLSSRGAWRPAVEAASRQQTVIKAVMVDEVEAGGAILPLLTMHRGPGGLRVWADQARG